MRLHWRTRFNGSSSRRPGLVSPPLSTKRCAPAWWLVKLPSFLKRLDWQARGIRASLGRWEMPSGSKRAPSVRTRACPQSSMFAVIPDGAEPKRPSVKTPIWWHGWVWLWCRACKEMTFPMGWWPPGSISWATALLRGVSTGHQLTSQRESSRRCTCIHLKQPFGWLVCVL